MEPILEKAEIYKDAAEQIAAVNEGESYLIARFATAACILNDLFEDFFWTGFYMVAPDNEKELVVGPYQGTLGCLRIPFGKGVCGSAAAKGETIIVKDVHAFPGHIACDSRSNSEIVVPVFDKSNKLIAVLDVDSTSFETFDEIDQTGLEAICAGLAG